MCWRSDDPPPHSQVQRLNSPVRCSLCALPGSVDFRTTRIMPLLSTSCSLFRLGALCAALYLVRRCWGRQVCGAWLRLMQAYAVSAAPSQTRNMLGKAAALAEEAHTPITATEARAAPEHFASTLPSLACSSIGKQLLACQRKPPSHTHDAGKRVHIGFTERMH